MSQLRRILLLLLCLQGPAWADEAGTSNFLSDDSTHGADLHAHAFDRVARVLRDSERPAKQTLAFTLAPKLLEIRANYWEKRRAEDVFSSSAQSASLLQGGYYNMLAKTSPWGGRLIGEGEVAYSALGVAPLIGAMPFMTRFGIAGNWNKAGYGLTFRSFGRGFVPLAGAAVEHDREEAHVFGEYNFDLFRLRGTAGEICEVDSVSRQLTITRNAAASFQLNKPSWALLLSSNYAVIGRSQPEAEKTFALSNRLAFVYRPAPTLTFEPVAQLSREWQAATGAATDTPSAGFSLAYTPLRELQLVGRASLSKSLREDLRSDASSISSAAGIHWRLSRSFLGDGSVSLQLEYKNDSAVSPSDQNQGFLTGSIQLKLAGF